MKKTTQTLKEKYLIPEVEITNLIAEQGFGASGGSGSSSNGGSEEPQRGYYDDDDNEMYSY